MPRTLAVGLFALLAFSAAAPPSNAPVAPRPPRALVLPSTPAPPPAPQPPAPAPPPAPAVVPAAVVKAKPTVASGAAVFLDGSGSTSAGPLLWKQIAGPEAFWTTFDKDSRRSVALLIPAPEDGLYRFALIATGTPSGGDVPIDVGVVDVTVGGAAPSPVPPPGPGPTPPPPAPTPAISGTIWVSYVAPASPTVAQAALRTSPTLRSGLAALQAQFRTYQDGQAELDALGMAAQARSLGTPCAIVQGPDGKVLASIKAPDEATILSTVAKFRGK
jgi:hypothetical protein